MTMFIVAARIYRTIGRLRSAVPYLIQFAWLISAWPDGETHYEESRWIGEVAFNGGIKIILYRQNAVNGTAPTEQRMAASQRPNR